MLHRWRFAGVVVVAAAGLGLCGRSAEAVEWLGYQEGLALAAEEGRPVMLFFDIGDENGEWFTRRVLTGEPVDPYRDLFVPVRVKQGADAIWKRYGIESGPNVLFVGPDGEILTEGYWRAAGALAGSMKEALRKHGPIIAPKLKAEAERLVAEMQRAMARDRYAEALAAARALEKLTSVDAYAKRVKLTYEALSARGRGALERAAKLEEGESWLEAKRAYEAIREEQDGLPEAEEAAKRLNRLVSHPEIGPAIVRAEREEAAAEALETANALYEKKPHEGLAAWDDVVKRWPKTAAGGEAKKRAKACREDPEAMRAVREAAAREVCPKWISLAKSYAAAGDREKARSYLERVREEHPGTSYAGEAEKLLGTLR